jgi:hypothetical protein
LGISAPQKEIIKAISYFKGLKMSVNNTQVDDESSPDMLNLLSTDRGALSKRPGRKNLFTSIDPGATYIATYRKSTGDIYVFAHGTKFYKITNLSTGTYSLAYTGLSGNKIRGFNYNDKFYFLDGTNYYVYDGTSVSIVTGKIPTVAISTPPTGGGTPFESLNYIQPGFKQQFSGNGSAVAYQLALSGLDGLTVVITVNGVTKVENTDFTVNRTTGVITFVSAPASGVDNVIITAYKTFASNKAEIFNCTIPYVWGGTDGSRIWFAGNSNYRNRDYVSGVQDPTYWPVTGFDNIGGTDSSIKGYSELYGALLIIKQRGIFLRKAEIEDNETIFRTERLNGDIGTEATDSIQILDSFPTFVNKKGVYQVTSIDTTNERNVRHISDDIDKNANVSSIKGILEIGNLESYVSADFDNKYWLFNPVNGVAWVYDYRYLINDIGQWFKLDNLYASSLQEIDSVLYMGDSQKGTIHKFMVNSGDVQHSDVEGSTRTPINAYWTSKIFDYDTSTNLKLVSKIFFTIKPSSRTSADLYVRSNLRSLWNLVKSVRMDLFGYSLVRYSAWTYSGNDFPQQSRAKVKTKKVGYYQMKLQNNYVDESLGILNVTNKILYQREVKH